MRKLLQDRVIIVLGVGPALGHSTALMCTEEGARVVLVARSQEMLDTVAADVAARGGAAHSVAMDMTSAADCKRLVAETVERFGRVDGLVCIAYKHHDSKLITESDDDLASWREIMDVNFFGTMLVIKQVIEQMAAQGDGGSIVIINSMNSHNPWPRTLPYSAAKAALASASRVPAVEYGPQQIRVNNLHAGAILNDGLNITLNVMAERNGTTRDEEYHKIASMGALQSIATPEEYMGSVLYLLSDLSAPATGISVHVNSGRYMA